MYKHIYKGEFCLCVRLNVDLGTVCLPAVKSAETNRKQKIFNGDISEIQGHL